MPFERRCPDCPDTVLSPIKILQPGLSVFGHGAIAASTKPRRLQGFRASDIIGRVHGFTCPECARVLLYLLDEEAAESVFEEAAARVETTGVPGALTLSQVSGGALSTTDD